MPASPRSSSETAVLTGEYSVVDEQEEQQPNVDTSTGEIIEAEPEDQPETVDTQPAETEGLNVE